MADRTYYGELSLVEKEKPPRVRTFLVALLDKLHIRGDGSTRRYLRIEQTTAGTIWALNNFETGASEGAGNFGINLVGTGAALIIKSSNRYISFPASLPAYANNAAALAGGLVAGDLYRTNGDPDTVCIVH